MAANSQLQRDYFCTNCGRKTDRDKLTVKKVVFTEMGSKAKTFKSRAVEHLCDRPTCLPADPVWNLPPYSEPEFKVMPEGFEDENDGDEAPVADERDLDPDQPMLPGMEDLVPTHSVT